MRLLIPWLMFSACLSPVAESFDDPTVDSRCVDTQRSLHLSPFYTASVRGQFVATDSGYAFATLLATNAAFDDWWAPSGPPAARGPVAASSIWFHPDGYRTVMGALTGTDPPLWLLDIDPSFRTQRATTLLASVPGKLAMLIAPRGSTRRRLDICLTPMVGMSRLFTIDGDALVQRLVPGEFSRCVNSIQSAEGTLFLVETGHGTKRVVRVTPTDVDWVGGVIEASCLLGLGRGGSPSLWCVDGHRLWLSAVDDPSKVDYELQGASDWTLIDVLEGVDPTVVVHDQSRYWLVAARGQRWSSESVPGHAFFGRVAADRVVFGSRVSDGGTDLSVVCWQ